MSPRSNNIPMNTVSKYKTPPHPEDLRLLIDSGCTKSIKSNKFNLESYRISQTEMGVADAKAPNLTCVGEGSLQINSAITIDNFLHCRYLALNLLSVAQLADLDLIITFYKSKCW
jgi:hypothetical protein